MGTPEDAAIDERLEQIRSLAGHEKRAAVVELAQDLAHESAPANQLVPLFTPTENCFDFSRAELVRLDKLPAPPGWRAHAHAAAEPGDLEPDAGYGLGSHLNRMLGGGIGPGEIAVLGALGPGSGKTNVFGQVDEGLAQRSAEMMRDVDRWSPITTTLTPVVRLSEMSMKAMLGRAVARWIGLDGNAFRQGRHWEGFAIIEGKPKPLNAAQAQQLANDAVRPGGPLAALSEWLHIIQLSPGSDPVMVVEQVRRHVAQIVKKLRAEASAREFDIVPVVDVDPLQRYQGSDDEIRGLNTLIEGLSDAAKADGFAVLATSDTNKDSSTGAAGGRAKGEREARERGAKALRGSNKLLHLADASLYLERDWDLSDAKKNGKKLLPNGYGEIELVISKNRNGPGSAPYARARWHYETGRVFACTESYTKKRQEVPNGGDEGSSGNAGGDEPPGGYIA